MEITKPGKYKLNKNIFLSKCEPEGISILADNVSLDLNGYSIISSRRHGTAIKIRGNGVDIYNGQISKVDTAFLFAKASRINITGISVSKVNNVFSGDHVENLTVDRLIANKIGIFLNVKSLISSVLKYLNVTKARQFALLTVAKQFSLENSQISIINPGSFILTSIHEAIDIDIQIENNKVIGGIDTTKHNFFALDGKAVDAVKILIQDNYFEILGKSTSSSIRPAFPFQAGFYFNNVSTPKTIIFRRNILNAHNIDIGFLSFGNLLAHLPPTNDSIIVSHNEFHLNRVYVGIGVAHYETPNSLPLPFSILVDHNKILGMNNNTDVITTRNVGIAIEFTTGVNILNNEISSFIYGIYMDSEFTFLFKNSISDCHIGIDNFETTTGGRGNNIFNCQKEVNLRPIIYLGPVPSATATAAVSVETNPEELNMPFKTNIFNDEK